MVTEVNMRRELFGQEILQKSKSEMFSATTLAKAGNVWRRKEGLSDFSLRMFLENKSTKDFIAELESKYGKCIELTRGRNGNTWVHPLLFIDIALAISPKLKIEVYEWLFDNLLRYRNDSGDSYKRMAAALWSRFDNKREFGKFIASSADMIRDKCRVSDWESATEKQLELRDKIHNSITTLTNVLTNPYECVRIGIEEHVKILSE